MCLNENKNIMILVLVSLRQGLQHWGYILTLRTAKLS